MTTTKTKSGAMEKTGSSIFAKTKNHARSVFNELKKVHWPNRKQLMAYTAIVFMAVVLCAIVIWVYDVGISFVLDLIHKALA